MQKLNLIFRRHPYPSTRTMRFILKKQVTSRLGLRSWGLLYERVTRWHLRRCWCRQPVDQLSVTARFLWLQRGRGTVCHHRPGPPLRYWHFGGRPKSHLFRQ